MTGERTPKLLEAIDKVAESRQRRVKTTELNKFVERVAAEHPPASPGKGHVRILYAAQTSVAPPTFVFFTNIATTFHFSYQRYLENRLARGVRLRGNAHPDPRARPAARKSARDEVPEPIEPLEPIAILSR